MTVASDVVTTQISPSKDNKDNKNNTKNPKKKKGKASRFFRLLTIIILCAVFYIYWDPINAYLAPKLKDVPYLNQVFFIDPDGDLYEGWSANQLIAEIEQLKATVLANEEQLADKNIQITDLQGQIERLQIFEDEYNTFIEEKDAFNFQLAEANPALFTEQYEKMEPDIAQEIYAQLISGVELSAAQKAQANTITEMDSATAAEAITLLLATDADLIRNIFANMTSAAQASILDEMSAENAAQAIRLTSP
ncbi:hypothetical protein [Candidatus Epulonipiscium viviparus]|uniref:hypothetical protein n=1 Tax=Candidatus Epulonipiscium viviparus TaxID=420336 RepID=UPI0027380AB3|nr:hypothetical protein [Candidatus Epulopiscium viviparus]